MAYCLFALSVGLFGASVWFTTLGLQGAAFLFGACGLFLAIGAANV